jgi:hypothetical protein
VAYNTTPATNVGQACAQRDPEVVGWVKSLGYSRERLAGLAQELHNRLDPVMRPPEPNACCDKELPANCGLAVGIQGHVIGLNEVESLLNDILRRLEI